MCKCLIIVLSSLLLLGYAEKCTTPNNEQAFCISLFTCPTLLHSLVSQNSVSVDFYKQSTCGGTSSEPLVCCGSSSSFNTRTESQEEKKCFTPNGEEGKCISLFSCGAVTSALAVYNSTTVQFYQQSLCGGTTAQPLICCGSSGSFVTNRNDRTEGNNKPTTKPTTTNDDKMKLLPDKRVCGLQHSDDYFRGENDTSVRITEFPWLAAIKYPKTTVKCGGSLINRRYVLTAAQCVNNPIIQPIAVHLGEYDDTVETDCVKESQFDEECSEPLQVFDIEKAISHPNYKFGDFRDDIALIRLNKTVQYTDYVRPICLPFPGTKLAEPGNILRSSGWGRSGTGTYASVKKRVLGKLLSTEQCAVKVEEKTKQIQITDKLLCTSSQNVTTDFDCSGDSGGPLIFAHKSQWHQEGITSFGSRVCGTDFPDVYTRVVKYLDWILDNIED